MIIALIKNELCVNVAVFDTIDLAKKMLQTEYDLVLACPENRGIGHRYIDGIWYNPQPERDADGIFPYAQDICVSAGDLVYGSDGKIYKALTEIKFQQNPPEELPETYSVIQEE